MKSEKGIDLSELSFETKRDTNFYIKEKFKDSSKFTQSQINKIENVAKSLEEGYPRAVSYTHLTLPTILRV